MNINPFIILASNCISLYIMGFVIWIIMTWLIRFNIINQHQSFVNQAMKFFFKLFEPPLVIIRKYIPSIGGVDLSPLILLLLLNFAKEFLFTYFYKM